MREDKLHTADCLFPFLLSSKLDWTARHPRKRQRQRGGRSVSRRKEAELRGRSRYKHALPPFLSFTFQPRWDCPWLSFPHHMEIERPHRWQDSASLGLEKRAQDTLIFPAVRKPSYLFSRFALFFDKAADLVKGPNYDKFKTKKRALWFQVTYFLFYN